MSSSSELMTAMKSFKLLFDDNPLAVRSIIKNSDRYFAHTSDSGHELLADHLELTYHYFDLCLRENGMEVLLDSMFIDVVESVLKSPPKLNIVEPIKLIFLNAIIQHDLGKINTNFQNQLMGNALFDFERDSVFGTKHSKLGAILFSIIHLEFVIQLKLGANEKEFLAFLVFLLSYSIIKHHGSIDSGTNIDFTEEEIDKAYLYIHQSLKTIALPRETFIKYCKSLELRLRNTLGSVNNSDPFLLGTLLKIHSALLTGSDYYATNHFTMQIKPDQLGVITPSLKKKIINGITNIPYNAELFNDFDKFLHLDPNQVTDVCSDAQNLLRQSLAAQVVRQTRKSLSNRIYYLEAPTGAGKTNLSLLFLSEQLKQRKDIKKIFYVFPLTTIITQTSEFFKSELGLTPAEFVEVHSRSMPESPQEEREENYGEKRKNYLDTLFFNFPITMVSHVKFFSVCNDNHKDSLYLLPRLANSIVVIDELQSYSPAVWDKINYLLKKYSDLLNITFLLMSATLPKITQLHIEENEELPAVTLLPPNKEDYFRNPNFKNRVSFSDHYLSIPFDNGSFEKLIHAVKYESEKYFVSSGNVKSLIAFITVKRAQDFYGQVCTNDIFSDYQILLLTGTTLQPRRREIIAQLKAPAVKGSKLLLIATQVIEAGVDIDMDLGFKDFALPDSEAQMAGRVNRNSSKLNSTVFIFNTGDGKKVYGSDLRYKHRPAIEAYAGYLSEGLFSEYYEKVLNDIDGLNNIAQLSGKIGSYKEYFQFLDYQKLNKSLKIIDTNSIQVFVPMCMPASLFNQKELHLFNLFNIPASREVNGHQVFRVYEDLIQNKDLHFVDKKIELKLMYPLLSLFSFSALYYSNSFNLLKKYSQERYGFYYIHQEFVSDIYSLHAGLIINNTSVDNFI